MRNTYSKRVPYLVIFFSFRKMVLLHFHFIVCSFISVCVWSFSLQRFSPKKTHSFHTYVQAKRKWKPKFRWKGKRHWGRMRKNEGKKSSRCTLYYTERNDILCKRILMSYMQRYSFWGLRILFLVATTVFLVLLEFTRAMSTKHMDGI